jgi:hypothetical protein
MKGGRRPEVETLEGRVVPAISFTGPGDAGLAAITGTSAADQFRISLQQSPGSAALININDGTTSVTTALSGIGGVVINGNGGNDSLTFIVSHDVLVNTNFPFPLPITFNNTLGPNTLNLLSDTVGINVNETFTLGNNNAPNQLVISTGSRNNLTNLISFAALPSATAINDSLIGSNFIFNANGANNQISMQNQGANNLVISGLNAQAMMNFGSGPGSGDFRGQNAKPADDNSTFINFLENQNETLDNAFAPITLSNKATVTVNGQAGADLFVVNLTSVPAGLKSVTINGNYVNSVLAGVSLPTASGFYIYKNLQRVDTNANSIFVDLLYAEILNRTAEWKSLNYWGDQLATVMTRYDVINGIEQSAEGRTNLLRNWYRHLLRRDLDSYGMSYWLGLFQQGATEEQVEADILGSPEFAAVAQNMIGGTDPNQSAIQAMYQLLLNRTADNSALSYWWNFLQNNSMATAAQTILQSQEFRALAVSGFYLSLLGRRIDDVSKNFFASPDLQGQSLSQMRKMIEDSPEFYARGQKH